MSLTQNELTSYAVLHPKHNSMQCHGLLLQSSTLDSWEDISIDLWEILWGCWTGKKEQARGHSQKRKCGFSSNENLQLNSIMRTYVLTTQWRSQNFEKNSPRRLLKTHFRWCCQRNTHEAYLIVENERRYISYVQNQRRAKSNQISSQITTRAI